MIAGFSGGKGFFKPGLFITNMMLQQFPEEELRAVINHEVAHVALNHIRKRFVRGILSTLGAMTVSILVITLMQVAHVFAVPEAGGISLLAALTIGCAIPLVLMRSQAQRQEFEADAYAVVELEVSLDAFAGALRRIDALNDQLSSTTGVQGRIDPNGGHPATETRIVFLRQRVEYARIARRVAKAAQDYEKKAA